MIILRRLFVGPIAILLGYLLIKYTDRLLMSVGNPEWMDNFPGGAQAVWKIAGIILIMLGIVVLLGGFSSMGL